MSFDSLRQDLRHGIRTWRSRRSLYSIALIGRLIESLLFQVKPADAGNLVAVCALLDGVGVLAGFLPARAASRIDPSVALREG